MVYRALMLFVLCALVLCGSRAAAQQQEVPLQRDFYIDVERNAAAREARVHSGLKPVLQERADLTHVMGHRVDSTKYYYWITEKIFKDHFLEIKGEDFKLTADPLFQFEYGQDFGDRTAYRDTNNYYSNVRGVYFTGDIGSKISFQTLVQEHQAVLPQYIFLQAASTGVMSGQGRAKLKQARVLDYGWSQGHVSFAPVQWLNVQFGQGRHFVGHGYRSVLLSDHAVSAPYLKFSALTRNKRFQYTTWVSKLQSGVQPSDRLPTGESSESMFYWMHGRFNHASVNLGPVQVGLFEATLFQNIDSNGVRPFDCLELNPVIGVNSIVRGFHGKEKSLLGLDLRVKITDKGYFYGQYATDDPGSERFAYQAGIRWFDVVRKDLHVQLEYNAAAPFMYMHDPAKLAYKHAGLPLAHPFGANFSEAVAIVDAGFDRVIAQVKMVVGQYQRDSTAAGNNGSDLLKPDAGTPAGTLTQELAYVDANVSYQLNHHTNLRLYAGVQRHSLTHSTDGQQSTFVYFGIRTNLFNRYYDL
ncbi:MAG: hypothetical protein JNM62_12960 [Flavobacteriales bacterium]|nr:hypothetical protein [Flavobacteriales bacterium]